MDPKSKASQSTQYAAHASEDEMDDHPLCGIQQKHELSEQQRARKPRARFDVFTILTICVDAVLAAAALTFLAFAWLVFTYRGQPSADSLPAAMLQAAAYGSTIFPIVFAAIIGRFLRAVAALKMERGSTVLTMEYLLGSRTLVSAMLAPLELRALHILPPILLVLWAFSPLGSQASLRIIWVGPSLTTENGTLAYLTYFSRPIASDSNGGQAAVSAVNPLYMGTLVSPLSSQSSPRDQYGNVKIPLYQDAGAGAVNPWKPNINSTWLDVPRDEEPVVWSSLLGIPIHGLPTTGRTELNLSTSYMTANCQVYADGSEQLASLSESKQWDSTFESEIVNCTSASEPKGIWNDNIEGNCFSGLNYMLSISAWNISSGAAVDGSPWKEPGANFAANVTFKSLVNVIGKRPMTIANCSLSISYVEVGVSCDGQDCRSTAIRPVDAANAPRGLAQRHHSGLDIDHFTPLLQQSASTFFAHFINGSSFGPINCPEIIGRMYDCPTSRFEGYLMDPGRLDWDTRITKTNETLIVWEVGNHRFSQRFTQLLNTYWIASAGRYAIASGLDIGRSTFSKDLPEPSLNDPPYSNSSDQYGLWEPFMPYPRQYGSDANTQFQLTPSLTTTTEDVICCSTTWFVVLAMASSTLLLASIATAIINVFRKTPDVLTSFTSLLRYSRYAELPPHSSLDDSVDIARRSGKTRVIFGNVKPDEDIGYATLAIASGDSDAVTKLDRRRFYD